VIVVTGGRQSGKTNAVIRWLLEQPGERAVIVGSFERADYIIKQLRQFDFRFPWKEHIIIANGDYIFNSQRGLSRFHHLAIDDAEYVLSRAFGADIDFMTVNATWIPLAPSTETVRAEVIQDKEIEAYETERDIRIITPKS